MEIPGSEGRIKAKNLAEKLKEAVSDRNDIKIRVPNKQAEFLLIGLMVATSEEDIITKIVEVGECERADIRMGKISFPPNGTGSVWVQCPIAAARRVIDQKRITIRWASARVVGLPSRKLQCYKCLQPDHIASKCTSQVDYSSICYKCGESGHKVISCHASESNCILCATAGRAANHRMGRPACRPLPPVPTRTRKVSSPAPALDSGKQASEEEITPSSMDTVFNDNGPEATTTMEIVP